MTSVPTIGGARGIFEIFIPGLFLLLNIALVILFFPFIDDHTKDLIKEGASNTLLSLSIAVCFGYLFGVLLRLLRVEKPDIWSGKWIRKFSRRAKNTDGDYLLFVTEKFPFIEWLEDVCKYYLPKTALQFYERFWAERKRKGQNRQFFNFCKVIISSMDVISAKEIYAAEALCRYIASMFFALMIASFLIVIDIMLNLLFYSYFPIGLTAIIIPYLIAMMIILNYFRYIRIKEC